MSWGEAGRAVLAYHFARLLANEQGTVDGNNPEALHDMRVVTARLRAALRDFRKTFPENDLKALTDDVRWLSNLLGRLRDLDVFIEWLRNYREHAPVSQQAFVDRVIQEREAVRARERAALLAGLRSPRHERLKQDFDRLIRGRPGGDQNAQLLKQARVKIERQLKRVSKAKKRANAKHLTRLHQLRIEFKRLRYTAEFFSSLYSNRLQKLTKTSREIQDELGGVHDASEYTRFLREMLNTQSSDPDNESTLNQMVAALKQQKNQQYKEFRKSYDKYSSGKFKRKTEKELRQP